MRPGPLQQPRPPITIGGHGPRVLRLAAAHADRWNSVGLPAQGGATAQAALEITRQRNQQLDACCAALGRDPRLLRRSLLVGFTPDTPLASSDAFHEFIGRYREAGVTEFIFPCLRQGPPEPLGVKNPLGCITAPGPLESVAAEIGRLRTRGEQRPTTSQPLK